AAGLVVAVLAVVVVHRELAVARERTPLPELVSLGLTARLRDHQSLARIAGCRERRATVLRDAEHDLVGAVAGCLDAVVGRIARVRKPGGGAAVALVGIRV